MAKLSARNRYELARVEKETLPPETQTCYSCKGNYTLTVCAICEGKGVRPTLCNWERKTLALMSDGKILEKRDVRFRPSTWQYTYKRAEASIRTPEGRKHSYGWTVKGKAKEGLTAERFVEVYKALGYVQVATRV